MTSLIRHVLFVFSGAFTQLDASLQHQYRQQQQEAEAKEELPDVLHLAQTADFV